MSNYIALSVNLAVGFLLTPFIIKHLGETGYGIWILITAFIGYYGLLNLGVNSAIERYLALYKGQGNEGALRTIASTAMAMFCFTGLLATSISFFIVSPMAVFFDVPADRFNDFRNVVWILGIATGISFPSEVFSVMMTSREQYRPANYVKIAVNITRAGLIVILLLSDFGIVGVASAVLCSQIFGLIANYFMVRFQMPHIQIRFAHVQYTALKRLVCFGGISMVIVLGDYIRLNIDSLVIGKFVGLTDVGVYAIAAIIIQSMRSLINVGMVVFTPRFAYLQGSGDAARLKELFVTSLRVASFLAFGCCLGVIVFGKNFILLWVGDDYLASATILWILAVPSALTLAQNTGIGVMLALKKHHFFAIANLCEAIGNLVLSLLLVAEYGIVGVALGTAIPMIIIKTIVQPIYVSKIVGLSVTDYARAVIPYALISFTLVFFASHLGVMAWVDVTFPVLIFACIAAGGIYSCFSYFQLSEQDRNLLLSSLDSKMGRLGIKKMSGTT